jgi:hypothetical protein
METMQDGRGRQKRNMEKGGRKKERETNEECDMTGPI